MIAGGISTAVYVLVAWAGAKIFEIHFWWVFGGLYATRAFFGAIEGIAGIINWRLFGKRAAVDGFLAVMRANNFPPREHPSDDFSNYSARIGTDEPLEPNYKRANREMSAILLHTERSGILAGMRLHAASDDALNMYSKEPSHLGGPRRA
jgi:hypothetical protein